MACEVSTEPFHKVVIFITFAVCIKGSLQVLFVGIGIKIQRESILGI